MFVCFKKFLLGPLDLQFASCNPAGIHFLWASCCQSWLLWCWSATVGPSDEWPEAQPHWNVFCFRNICVVWSPAHFLLFPNPDTLVERFTYPLYHTCPAQASSSNQGWRFQVGLEEPGWPRTSTDIKKPRWWLNKHQREKNPPSLA